MSAPRPDRLVSILGAPAIGVVLVVSWLLPLAWWAVGAAGVVCTTIFVLVLIPYRHLGRRLFAKPAVLAALVMAAIAFFTLGYAVLALEQTGSVMTNGGQRPDSLGVAALLATSMGIAGGEVGVQIGEGARVIAQVQLLLVIGAVAGAGGQVLQRLTNGGTSERPPPQPEPGPGPRDPTVDLYAAVHRRLTERGGDAVLNEMDVTDPRLRQELRERLSGLPSPSTVSILEAVGVFEQIIAGNLEYFYGISFGPTILANAVRPFTHFGAP